MAWTEIAPTTSTPAAQDPQAQQAQQPQAPAVDPNMQMPTDAEQTNMSGMMGVQVPQVDPTQVLKSPDASPDDKLRAMSYLQSQQQAQAQQQQATQAAQLANDKNALDAYNTKVKQVSDYNTLADQQGYPKIAVPTPDQFGLKPDQIAQLAKPEVRAVVDPMADAMKQQADLDKTQKQAEDYAHKQAAALNGMQKASADIAKSNQQSLDLATKQIDDRQDQLSKIDPNRFWNNQSTGSKILAALAIGMGALGSRDGKNVAIDQINKYIDDDIGSQKFDVEKRLELKQQALKRVGLEIEKFGAISQDNYRKAEMSKMQAELKMQQDQLRQQLLMSQNLSNRVGSGSGFDAQEAEMLVPEKDKKRIVQLPNGRYTLAPNETVSETFNKALPSMVKIKSLGDEYVALANSVGAGDKLTPAQLSDTKQRLMALKTELIPLMKDANGATGVRLNNNIWQKFDKDIFGDPTAIFQSPDVAKHKANDVGQMINSFIRSNYSAAGIKLQDDQEHAARMRGLNMGLSLEHINKTIDNMKQQGKIK